MVLKPPKPEDIAKARAKAALTQRQAAELVHVSVHTWRSWEQGSYKASLTAWELFLLKTHQQ